MFDVLTTVASLAVVFSLAAGILFIVDRFSLRRELTKKERRDFVEKRSLRWGRRYGIFTLILAVIALVVNAFNLGHEPLGWRIGWSAAAAAVVIRFLLPKDEGNEKSKEERNE